jgi:hypothetical protein
LACADSGLEFPPAPAHAGGGPVFDPEQFRLEQRFDERGAVDRHERPVAAVAQFMNLPRDQFLADTAFALEQHREVGACDAFDGMAQGLHRLCRSDEWSRRITPGARAWHEPRAKQLHARPFDFHDQRADVRRHAERLHVPLAQTAPGIERRLQHARRRRVAASHFECNQLVRLHVVRRQPASGRLAQVRRPCWHHALQRFLKRHSHARDVAASVQAPHDRRQQLGKPTPAIASPRRARLEPRL